MKQNKWTNQPTKQKATHPPKRKSKTKQTQNHHQNPLYWCDGKMIHSTVVASYVSNNQNKD